MLALVLLASSAWSDGNDDALRETIKASWQVSIVDTGLEQSVVPRVATVQRPVTMADLSAQNATPCLSAVQTAFQAYPPSLVSKLVQQVALSDMIHAWSIRIGGFHAPGLLAINCENASDNAVFETDSVHDELAALLLDRVNFDTAAWRAFNPPGFRYGDFNSYKAELRDPGSRDGETALHRDGFVATLGLTGVENDFQTYAERVFGHPQEFAALLRRQPAMRGKARLLMTLYISQAPLLSANFAKSGLTAAAAE